MWFIFGVTFLLYRITHDSNDNYKLGQNQQFTFKDNKHSDIHNRTEVLAIYKTTSSNFSSFALFDTFRETY